MRPPSNTLANSHLDLDRRDFLRAATVIAAAGLPSLAAAQQPAKPNAEDAVELSQIHSATEAPEKTPGPFEAPDQRIGFAVVGLGRLSLNQILPAMAKSKYCKPVALVSGSPDKARKVAAQYGIRPEAIYDYAGYDRLARNPEAKIIYIVLPNAMHAEFVIRGAKAGKHILCEKPMATSAADCERMIAACKTAGVKLMIAYRQQYEPMNRELQRMIRSGTMGAPRSIVATNTQDQGDPTQWRLNRKLSGGGCLPDVGIYCLNAARFLSGEEPTEVMGATWQPSGDPRFKEVEATCTFTLRFPSGLLATLNSGYAGHRSQFLRVECADAWAELNPAFGYTGLKLRSRRLVDKHDVTMEPSIEEQDQFALEMDHMAQCVIQNTAPHTPGEEGLQDQRLIDAIYESARTGREVKVPPPTGPTRGQDLPEES
jgi:predicted dehydrogenase